MLHTCLLKCFTGWPAWHLFMPLSEHLGDIVLIIQETTISMHQAVNTTMFHNEIHSCQSDIYTSMFMQGSESALYTAESLCLLAQFSLCRRNKMENLRTRLEVREGEGWDTHLNTLKGEAQLITRLHVHVCAYIHPHILSASHTLCGYYR